MTGTGQVPRVHPGPGAGSTVTGHVPVPHPLTLSGVWSEARLPHEDSGSRQHHGREGFCPPPGQQPCRWDLCLHFLSRPKAKFQSCPC